MINIADDDSCSIMLLLNGFYDFTVGMQFGNQAKNECGINKVIVIINGSF